MGIAQFIPQFESSNAQFDADYLETVGQLDDFDAALGTVDTITGQHTLTPTIPLLEDDQSDISGWAQLYVRVDGVFGKTPDFTIDFTGFRGGGSAPTSWAPAWRYVDDTDPGTGKPRAWSKLGSDNTSPFTPDSAFTQDSIEVCIRPRFRYIDTKQTVDYLTTANHVYELPSSVAASSLAAHVIAEQTAQNSPNSTPDTVLNQYGIGFDNTASQPAGGFEKINILLIIGQHATEDASRYGGWLFVRNYAERTGAEWDYLRQHSRLIVYDANPTGVFAGRERFDSDDGTANDPNRAWDDTNSPTIEVIKSAIALDYIEAGIVIDVHNFGDWGFGGGNNDRLVGGYSSSGTAWTNFLSRISTAMGDTFVDLGTSTTGTAAWYGDSILGAQLSFTLEYISGRAAGYPDTDAEFALFNDAFPAAFQAMVENNELTLPGGAVSLTPDEAGQLQDIGGVTLTQSHVLLVDGVAQEQNLATVTLSQASSVTADDVDQTQAADQPSLTENNAMTLDSVDQDQAAGATSLTENNVLAPNALDQTQDAGSVVLTQAYVIAPDALFQSQQIGTVTLAQAGTLLVSGLSQVQAVQTVALTQAGILTPDPLDQEQSADEPSLVQAHVLTPDGLSQTVALESPTIQAFLDALMVNGLIQDQSTDPPSLTQFSILSVDDMTQSQLIDAINFGGLVIGRLDGTIAIYAALAGDVTLH